MKRLASRFALLFATLLLLPIAGHAQAFRAYVASYGSDANPCSVTQPCRLLPAAVNAIAPGGEVWMLDSANYNSGTVTITKNASILAVPGQIGSIVSVAGGPAISVSGFTLRLRNVAIVNNAVNPGTDGIAASGSSNVFIENSLVVAAPGSYGINATGATVFVHNVTFRDSKSGVHAAGFTSVEITGSRFSNNNYYGVFVDGNSGSSTTNVSVSDSHFSGGFGGMLLYTDTGNNVALIGNVIRSTFSNLTWGVAAVNGGGTSVSSLATVGQSSFSNIAATALDAESGGIVETMGDNQVRQVGTKTLGTTTVPHV